MQKSTIRKFTADRSLFFRKRSTAYIRRESKVHSCFYLCCSRHTFVIFVLSGEWCGMISSFPRETYRKHLSNRMYGASHISRWMNLSPFLSGVFRFWIRVINKGVTGHNRIIRLGSSKKLSRFSNSCNISW